MSSRPKNAFELRECPPHTAAKHALLRRYLGAWFPIIARWNKRVIYYDAFAGPGEYLGGAPGSPIIALETLLEHTALDTMADTEFVFLYNEQDEGCAEHLRERVAALQAAHQPWPANIKADVNNTTFIDLTTEILDDIAKKEAKLAPTFAFVDPVGVKATPMEISEAPDRLPEGRDAGLLRQRGERALVGQRTDRSGIGGPIWNRRLQGCCLTRTRRTQSIPSRPLQAAPPR